MDTSDFIAVLLGEPEVVVRAGRDIECSARSGWNGELRDAACRCDTGDLVGALLDEPDVAVGSRCNRPRTRLGGRNTQFREDAAGRVVPDLVASQFGEPQFVVGTDRDLIRTAGRRKIELRDFELSECGVCCRYGRKKKDGHISCRLENRSPDRPPDLSIKASHSDCRVACMNLQVNPKFHGDRHCDTRCQ